MQRYPVRSLSEKRYAETFAVFLDRSQEYPLMVEHLSSVIHRFPPGLDLFDVGAGTGFPIQQLGRDTQRHVGYYLGMEPNPTHLAALQRNLECSEMGRFDVVREGFEPTTPIAKKFDLVLFSHSLYGMTDPVGAFLHGASCLKTGGTALAYLQGPYGDYAMQHLFEPQFDRDTPSLENGMSSHELVNDLRERGINPHSHCLPSTIDMTGLFDSTQRGQLSEFLSFCLLVECESIPYPLLDDIVQYLHGACIEIEGKLLWHVPTLAITIPADSLV